MYPLNTIIVVLKPLYGIPKARTYWWAIYYKHHKEKLSIITFTYDPCFLIITKEVFSLIGMQIDNTLIIVLKEFSVLKDDEFNKVKFLIKFKEALALKTLLIFNGCVLI
jgi:hypothetical protein